MTTDEEKAVKAWLAYRDGPMKNWPKRQLRKREFISGYLAGVGAERERTRGVVTPANISLYELTRTLENDPLVLDELRKMIPQTLNRLRGFLRGEENPHGRS